MNKESNINLDNEFGVDSRYHSQTEKDQDSISLLESRLARMKNLNKEQIIEAKLFQLKFQMEAFLNLNSFKKSQQFVEFLKQYIEIFYAKKSDFAIDINIQSNLLSKILNHHREPNEEFLQKVMIHSEKTFKNITNFNSSIWYFLYFYGKIQNSISNQNEWRPQIEKQVKLTTF